MQKNRTYDYAKFSDSLKKWSLQFKQLIHEKGYREEHSKEEYNVFLFLAISILGSQSIYQLIYEQSFITISFLVFSIILIVGSLALKRYLSYFILLSQIIGIIMCYYRLIYLDKVPETNLNDFLQIGQISLCLILQGTGSFIMDVSVQISLIVISIIQADGLRSDSIFNLIITHVIFLGMKYMGLKKLKIIFAVRQSLNELLSFLNKSLNIEFLLTYLDPITHDLQVYDYNLKFARTTGLTSNFKDFLHKIKLDTNFSDIKEDIFTKKDPSLKDYLMQRHWTLNEQFYKKNIFNSNIISQPKDDNKFFKSSLDHIKHTVINSQQQNPQLQSHIDSSHLKQNSILQNQNQKKMQALPSQIDNTSFTQFKSSNIRINLENKNQEKEDQSNITKDSAIDRLRLMRRIDTLFGNYYDEQTNKRVYFKIKVGFIHMERPFLGITLENITEKKEYSEFKGSFKTQLHIFTQSIIQMKSQAIETIKQSKTISPSQMVPLLSQINLMDCLQDYLQRRDDQKILKLNKSSFNLRNLLKEIEDIFQVAVIIGESPNQTQNMQQQSSNNILFQKQQFSSVNHQGKPQRDSLFSKWKNNQGLVLGMIEIPPFLQQNSNISNTGSSKETCCISGQKIEKTIIDENTNINLQSQYDQFIINNDMYRLRQILIALTTNMISWNRALNGKKASVGEKQNNDWNQSQNYNHLEIICTEESNQLFDFFKIKFKLFCPHSPFMPSQDILLKYMNSTKDISLNKVCKKMIDFYVQSIGPYKLNAAVIDQKYIEISFDVFKNAEVMENIEKRNSFISQSQINFPSNSVTPPQTAGRSAVQNNFTNLISYSSNNMKSMQRSLIIVNQKKKQLHFQKLKQQNQINQMKQSQQSIANQIDLNINHSNNYNSNEVLSTQRQLVESEKLAQNSQDQMSFSHINFQYDHLFKNNSQQQQQQQQSNNNSPNNINFINNINKLKDSIQIGSPYNLSEYNDQSDDLQNNKSPDLNFAIKTLIKNQSISSLYRVNQKKLKQGGQTKSKSSSNLDDLQDFSISMSQGNYNEEIQKSVSLKHINLPIQKKQQIHTISSIQNNLI